jgi:hypothetical protein
MKNINRIFFAAFALVSTSVMAMLVQPLTVINDDAPVRLSIAAKSGVGPDSGGKFGATGVGGGIALTHKAGYEFSYGLAVAYDWTSPYGRVFSATSKPQEGSRIDAELSLGFMPELAERFNLGLNVAVGWGRQFGGELAKEINDSMKFGDLKIKVGPAMSLGFSDSVSMYLAANYVLQNIRFGAEGKAKNSANWSGVDIPLGFNFAFDNASVFVEANSRFTNLAKGPKYFKEEVTLGMSIAI